jgi:hypothetical protein
MMLKRPLKILKLRLKILYFIGKTYRLRLQIWAITMKEYRIALTIVANRAFQPRKEFAVWQVMSVLAMIPLLFFLIFVQMSHDIVFLINPEIRLEDANNQVVPRFPELAPVFQAWEHCNRDLNPTWAKCDAIAYPVAQKNGLAGRFAQYQKERGAALAQLEQPLGGGLPPPK